MPGRIDIKLFSVTIVLCLALCCSLVNAQYRPYTFSRLDISKGLPNNDVNCFFRDGKGFLWVGTLSGLARFDGNNFKIFRHNMKDTSSISDDDIRKIVEGPEGKLWIETRAGTDIFDPATETFNHDLKSEYARYGISERSVTLLKRTPSGLFCFISSNSGLNTYNPLTGRSRHFVSRTKNEKSIWHSRVADVAEDKESNLWVIHFDGTLELLNYKSNLITRRLSLSEKFFNWESDTYRIFIDRQGLIWIYNMSIAAGVHCYDPLKQEWIKFSKTSGNARLNSDMISGIIQDDNDNIWIGTDHGGINLLDKHDNRITYLVNDKNDDKSLSQNSISSMYYDRLGVVWIGTFRKGINFYHPGIIKFGVLEPSAAEGLISNDVNRMSEDKLRNLWIGTNGRGLTYYNRSTKKFSHYQHDIKNPYSLSHDAVVSIYFDRSNKLWVGTYSGGIDYLEGDKFKHFVYDPKNPQSLSDNRVYEFLEDSKGRFWIGTGGGGVNLLNRATGAFKRYTTAKGLISSDYVYKILEDSRHRIWIGTSFGMNLFIEGTDRFVRFINDPNDENSLANDNVNSFIEDKRGYLWICTRDGLSIYNPQSKVFQNFTKLDGLPDNNLMDIQQDNQGNFWISSSNGLSRVSVTYGKRLNLNFENFDQNDGLQGREFNRNASVKLKTGELAFGGPDGINIFHPDSIVSTTTVPKLFITDFQLFGKSLSKFSEGEKNILQKSITDTKKITLEYDQNVFVIEFAALNFVGPDRVKYQYMLEGFDKVWIEADRSERKAAYTNLAPGKYKFKLRSMASGIDTDQEGIYLDIIILDPWYTSSAAYVIYGLLIICGLYYLRKRAINRLRVEFSEEQRKIESQLLLENERLEVIRNRNLDAMKIKFLTNVSHEFRTPLTLILAPIDKLLQGDYDIQLKEQVSLINKNARRLLNLVNQLLDFRKMEMKELKLQKKQGDIVAFLRDTTYSFKDVGEKRNIKLVFNSTYGILDVNFDHDKIERILFNLLSNSFKFTLEGGKISVSLDGVMVDQFMLEIKVRDTGIGIPKENQEKIFESFFQNDLDDSILNQSSGIGLAITKEFVTLHKGRITVESDEGSGSCFTIILPFEELTNQPLGSNISSNELITDQETSMRTHLTPKISLKKKTVLIVEDDTDLRFYLKDNLKDDFNVIEAQNGKEGWQKALFYQPNIIVSDISMPEMNGIDLCLKIKSDARTIQIPVILLTAIAGEKEELFGLETGANDYVTKPFSFEILRSKIRNNLDQQESSRRRYLKQVDVSPQNVELESPDEQFLQEVLRELEKNIDNSNLSVEVLSKLVLVSRGTLYTRIVSLTGKTPLEFIKSYRLKRAAQLLEQNKFTVSGVCYKTGFKTTKNFVKSFKEEFGMLPSQYAESKRTS